MTAFCTLFADVGNKEVPIMISDVLVTSNNLPPSIGRYERTYIPTIGGIFPHVSDEAVISGLVQKLSMLPGGHCLAVAGDLDSIIRFYRQLVQNSHDFDEICRVCNEFSKVINFTLLVNDVARERCVTIASESCRRFRSDQYGLAIAGGSGESTLRSLLFKQQSRGFQGVAEFSELSKAFFLVSEALDLDSRDPTQTIEKSFGGYYEIATYDGEKFFKFDRVAYHYIRLDTVKNDSYWVLHKSIYHEYVNSDLVVRRVVWAREDGGGAVWQDCYPIGDLYKPADFEQAKAHIESTVPHTDWEVVCFEVGKSKFRTMSLQRNLVKIRKEGDRWFSETDTALMEQYIGAFIQAFESDDSK